MSVADDLESGVCKEKIPLVYAKRYNFHFFKLDKLHPFDIHKYSQAFDYLVKQKLAKPLDDGGSNMIYTPRPVSKEDLLKVHTQEYLASLEKSWSLARALEFPLAGVFPAAVIWRKLIQPMMTAVGGSVTACELALTLPGKLGISLGGGFHHAHKSGGGGFCIFADIVYAMKIMREEKRARKITIVDLDAHQGNGYERDLFGSGDTYIMDVYNHSIYPGDLHARQAIRADVCATPSMSDDEYIATVSDTLAAVLVESRPDLVIYIAGCDILDGDTLGKLHISPEGLLRRDETVVKACLQQGYPVAMLLAGGYCKGTGNIVGRSIANLIRKAPEWVQ